MRVHKRLDCVSSKVYAELVSKGSRGSTSFHMAGKFDRSVENVRSHLGLLVTEGLAEHVGYARWRAIIPALERNH